MLIHHIFFTGKFAMRIHSIERLYYPILILIFFLGFGCTTTKSVVQKIRPEKTYLKKKVMVFPPIDHSGLPSGRAAQTTSDLFETLKGSHHLLVYPPPENVSLPPEVKTPKFGVIYYDPALAAMARKMNMNAVIAVYLPPMDMRKGKGGMWPFRHETDVYTVSMVINVLDVSNMCLYLTEFFSEEVALESDEMKDLNEKEAFAKVWDMVLPDMLKHQASAVINTLSEKPWTGRILDVSDERVKINGGKDVGVSSDQVFSVYAQGDSIMCMTGRAVDLLGEKIGEIRAVSIAEDHALASPVTEGRFDVGQTVVFIPN